MKMDVRNILQEIFRIVGELTLLDTTLRLLKRCIH